MIHLDHFIKSINRDLKPHIDRNYRALVRDRYRMNVDNFWGVRIPIIHKIANAHYRQINPLSVDDRLKVCAQLLKTLVYEHKIIAFRFGHLCRKEYERRHFRALAGWLRTSVNDWSDGDDLCIHVFGEYLVRYPDRAKEVLAWTNSRNRWMKRGAAVALILPVRKGQLRDVVFHVADRLLNDQDDLVQKGYGWMLKEASKRYPQDVFNYVLKHRDTMPRTALRYAIEKLPPARRLQAMQKKQLF
jgi:3-methyladenine DNA glycosylase AlkD